MGGGDDPDTDGDLAVGPHGLHRPLLENAQEFGLDGGAQVPHLVQKEGAAVGGEEFPFAGGLGPSERTLHVAEEL